MAILGPQFALRSRPHDPGTDHAIDSGGAAASSDRGALGRQYAFLGATDRAGIRGPAAAGATSAGLSLARGAHGARDSCALDRSVYAAGVDRARARGFPRAWISCRSPAGLRSRARYAF